MRILLAELRGCGGIRAVIATGEAGVWFACLAIGDQRAKGACWVAVRA